jgi:adenine deaminase
MEVIQGNIVNIFDDTISWGEVVVQSGRIFSIKTISEEKQGESYLLPGFIDAHVHIESSMLTPSAFGRIALCHGSVASVSDPHEIANVLGIEGVEYMIRDARKTPFKIMFGAPSCVPATSFETAGAVIDSESIKILLAHPEIGYLAEMMNFPGVINQDQEVIRKIELANAFEKPIDGHAPGLRGKNAETYFSAGISTDHECFTREEAEEKLNLGVKILIREGSAAKNFDALIPLAKEWSHQMMFCSDDKHPDDLLEGHINQLVIRAIQSGIPLFDVLRMASLNPVKHYRMDVGLLQEGDPADFIRVKSLEKFEHLESYINGEAVARNGQSMLATEEPKTVNNFDTKPIDANTLRCFLTSAKTERMKIIRINEGQLVTDSLSITPFIREQEAISNAEHDVLKLVVYNRYRQAEPAIAFINGFGLKSGAIASSVAHDSHNIIAVGVNDEDLAQAINLVIREQGGISAVSSEKMGILPLPIAGLMSPKQAHEVAEDYKQIDHFVKKELECGLAAPYMSLSFMALLVIPSLKLSDLGLFDGNIFDFTDLFD